MTSNTGLTICKNRYLSFINKGLILFMFTLFIIVIVPCFCLMVTYWREMPMFIKILSPILSAIILAAIATTPFNGMVITKNDSIIFVPDFRVKKLKLKDLKRIAFNFSEWENNKYSAEVKFVYKDGRVFIKDYSRQFRNMKNKTLAMLVYTIKARKVQAICEKLTNLDVCVITIIDKDKNIIHQKSNCVS